MSHTRLFTVNNRSLIEAAFKTNPIFQRTCLKQPVPAKDILNSNTSLSNIQMIRTKADFYRWYKAENPAAGELKTFYKFCVMFLRFYKDGIQNTYTNFKEMRSLGKNLYVNNKDIIPGVKNQHGLIKWKDTRHLVKLLSNTVKNFENEYRATGDIGKLFDNPHQIQLSRSEFQKILRTSKDAWKLPSFALLFLLLEELTVVLCGIFPDITPSTCLIPQLTSRFYGSANKAQKELYKAVEGIPPEKLVSLSAYAIPTSQLHLMVDLLHLKSRYIPISFYTEETLRDRLQLRFQQIQVDNFLIVRDGGVWNLSKLELIDSCLQRGILDLDRFIEISKSKDANFIDQVDEHSLQLKLFNFINNTFAEGTNVGLLGYGDQISASYPPKEATSESPQSTIAYINSLVHN